MPDTSDIISQSLANYNEELPEGWTLFKLDDLLSKIQYGYTASALQDTKGPRFLRITDIQDDIVNWDTVPSCEISEEDVLKFELIPGDIVFARTGATTGKSYLIKSCPKSVFASYLIRIRPKGNVDSRFLYFFFHTSIYWRMISENLAGIAQPNCNASKLKTLEIPVPPLPEQHRIIAKVEDLFKEVNAAHDRLNKVPGILKHFRQAVLAAACSGRLTEKWRSNLGSTPLSCNTDEMVEVPDGWLLVNLEAVAHSRLGKMLDKIKNQGESVQYLRNVNVRWFEFDLSDLKEIKVSENEIRDLSVQYGDVLVCEGGEPGRCAVWRDRQQSYIFQKALHRVRVGDKILPEWICYCLKDSADSGRLSSLFTGSTIMHLTGISLKKYEFLLPPLEEQHEIVRRVESLFALADEIERQVVAATKRTDGLRQAILAKAFRGELVPTEAELERVGL